MTVSLLKPPNGGFRSETDKNLMAIYNGHFPTDTSVRSGVTVMQRPWPLVKANGSILVSESLPGIISASSKAVNYIKGSKPDLSH